MNMNNQNNNEEMKDIYNCDNSGNSGNRNPFIESKQSEFFEISNNQLKETMDSDNFSNQNETTSAGEALHLEDCAQKASVTENSVLNDKPNYEDKRETSELEGIAQLNHFDSGAGANYKDQWNKAARLNRRYVKCYQDDLSDQMVIFSSRAYNSIISETYAKDPVETGGILLGYILDNGFWIVTEVIPPGKSSVNQYAYFEYDTEFVNYVANRIAHQFKYPPQVLGLWHRHPGSMDTFSSVDDGTNATFSNNNRAYGAISALVNLDPKFRITIYHVKINECSQVQYQKMSYEVGDEFIPDEYFQLKYVAGTSKSHGVQDPNNVEVSKDALHNCSAVQEKNTNSQQNWEKIDYTLQCINITFELMLILFLSVNIAIFLLNPLINPLTVEQSAVPASESPIDQPSVVSTTNSLTDQSSTEKDWTSQFEEWSKVLDLSNEGSQDSVHNDIELSQLGASRDQIIQDDNNSQKKRSDEIGVFDDNEVDLTLDNEGNTLKQSYRNGYGAFNSEPSSDRSFPPLNYEKIQSGPDVNKQNLESGLPIKTAAVPREIPE